MLGDASSSQRTFDGRQLFFSQLFAYFRWAFSEQFRRSRYEFFFSVPVDFPPEAAVWTLEQSETHSLSGSNGSVEGLGPAALPLGRALAARSERRDAILKSGFRFEEASSGEPNSIVSLQRYVFQSAAAEADASVRLAATAPVERFPKYDDSAVGACAHKCDDKGNEY